MSVLSSITLSETGIDAVALKPSEMDLARAQELSVETLTIDFEGREHVPEPAVLESLVDEFDVRVTIPVRADGFDPLGTDSVWRTLPEAVDEVLVAGHRAYLTEQERKRSVAPRLERARARAGNPWVGTEGIERLALAVGGTQFDLLSRHTSRDVRSLRTAGFDGGIAVYAPTVLSDDEDDVLDAVGEYAARRKPVREALPGDVPQDSNIRGQARETLLEGCKEFALVGSPATVAERVEHLHSVGVDHVVAYPARGLDELSS